MRIKICGVTRLDDARAAAELGAWAIGMIFYEPSPRHASLDQAELIGGALHRRTELAGVFVNSSLEEIAQTADRARLTLIQLHGEEGPAFCAEVARRTGARVIKAASVKGPATLQDMARFHTDFHLLDGQLAGLRGGTGRPFDWSLIKRRRSKVPLILSGGLNPGNVAQAIEQTHAYALDVASGVESAPGIKDPELLAAFFQAVAAASPPLPLVEPANEPTGAPA
jgi:phosphoribosylanthranilate isomerase